MKENVSQRQDALIIDDNDHSENRASDFHSLFRWSSRWGRWSDKTTQQKDRNHSLVDHSCVTSVSALCVSNRGCRLRSCNDDEMHRSYSIERWLQNPLTQHAIMISWHRREKIIRLCSRLPTTDETHNERNLIFSIRLHHVTWHLTPSTSKEPLLFFMPLRLMIRVVFSLRVLVSQVKHETWKLVYKKPLAIQWRNNKGKRSGNIKRTMKRRNKWRTRQLKLSIKDKNRSFSEHRFVLLSLLTLLCEQEIHFFSITLSQARVSQVVFLKKTSKRKEPEQALKGNRNNQSTWQWKEEERSTRLERSR